MQPIAFFYTPTLPSNGYYSPNTFQICYFPQIAAQYELPILSNSNSQHEQVINSQISWKSFQTNPSLAEKPSHIAKPFTALISEESETEGAQEVPQKRRARCSGKQKFGRNILSNIFLMMVRFVQKSKKMKTHILKLIEANNLTIKISQFYNTIKRKSSKLKPYANEANITAFWRDPPASPSPSPKDQKQRQFSRIFRVVGRIYLNTYHIPYVYNTNKIKEESKKLHMGCVRRILHF